MALYPDFKLKLWGSKDITRENFPRSYDLIQTLLEVDKFTRFSKRATVADVMRHEILYNEGGFYMDSSMVLFKRVFDKWLSYKLVVNAELSFRHRWSSNMCFFAVMPKYPGLLRLINRANTNTYKIYKKDAMGIAGPHNFRQVVRGY